MLTRVLYLYYIIRISVVEFFLLGPRVLVITLRVWYACVRRVIQCLHNDYIALIC